MCKKLTKFNQKTTKAINICYLGQVAYALQDLKGQQGKTQWNRPSLDFSIKFPNLTANTNGSRDWGTITAQRATLTAYYFQRAAFTVTFKISL